MPKNPLKFGRRKSSVFDSDLSTPTTQPASSFRVLERPEKINLNGDPTSTARPVTRPFISPIAHLRASSTDKLDGSSSRSMQATGPIGTDWMLKSDRGSGGTIRSGSSFYESSAASMRHSSTSTLPSSVDAEKEADDEDSFLRKAANAPVLQDVPLNDSGLAPQPPSFTARAVQALSLAQKQERAHSDFSAPPTPPRNAARSPERHTSPRRERAMTTSSYASTAKPDPTSDVAASGLRDEFGYLFDRPSSAEKLDGPAPLLPPVAAYHRTDSPPIFTPRTQSRAAFRSSPDIAKDEADSPYAWDWRNSRDDLMSSSPVGPLGRDGPPLPPNHRASVEPPFFPTTREGYALVPERSSPVPQSYAKDSEDHLVAGKEAKAFGRQAQNDNRNSVARNYQAEGAHTTTRYEILSSEGAQEEESLFTFTSRNVTPRAAGTAIARQRDSSLFDSSPLGPPGRAIRPSNERENSNAPKKMTKAQFERLQRSGISSAGPSEAETGDESDEYDDEDDAERVRRMNKQRQRQEANMSVYRQQMKKVTGGGPTGLPSKDRPGFARSPASAPALTGSTSSVHLSGMGGRPPAESVHGKQSDDEDDDVPLGILQAHGFPRSSRPASLAGENDLNQRRSSPVGSVVAGGASPRNLPPFARNLPVDPYFGAGVVRTAHRESLGFSSSASVYGGTPPPTSMGHPGGLVGVIAGEERAKAARRGSPNPSTGNYGPGPLPANASQMGGFPGMQSRSISTGSALMPQIYTANGGIGQMPMMNMPMVPQMPATMLPEQQEQMQQFMQMQMEFMQNMIALQHQQMGQTPPAQQQQSADYLDVPSGQARRTSNARPASQAPSTKNGGRTMTMLSPPPGWNTSVPVQRPNSYAPSTFNPTTKAGYSPSIAPSERSNIGQPSRYRPVATSSNSRTVSMMSSSAPPLSNSDISIDVTAASPQSRSTIRAIDKPKGTPRVTTTRASVDEDEDAEDADAWAAMKKRREEKKRFRFSALPGRGKEISTDRLLQNLK